MLALCVCMCMALLWILSIYWGKMNVGVEGHAAALQLWLCCLQEQNKCVGKQCAMEAFKTLRGWFSPKTYCGEERFTALQKFRLIYVQDEWLRLNCAPWGPIWYFFLTCSFVSVLSSLQLMSYWQLYSSLFPPFNHAGSFPSSARCCWGWRTTTPICSKEADAQQEWRQNKVILSITPFLLWEVSESLLLFLPEAWARARSNCLTKSHSLLNSPTGLPATHASGDGTENRDGDEPAQCYKGNCFPLLWPSKMTKESNPKLPSASAGFLFYIYLLPGSLEEKFPHVHCRFCGHVSAVAFWCIDHVLGLT